MSDESFHLVLMSRTSKLYKPKLWYHFHNILFLGLNDTEGTLFVIQLRREALAFKTISKYIWMTATYNLVLGVRPNRDIGNNPNDVKISVLQPSFQYLQKLMYSYPKWVENPVFPNNWRIFKMCETTTEIS